jgi:ADP-ribosylglycohydrolase
MEYILSDKGGSMETRETAPVLASFAADALALGVHWIYDTRRIADQFGRVDTFMRPGPDSFHPVRKQGEFTHYGDQSYVLLESLSSRRQFDPDDFSKRWIALFTDYDGYYDKATKGTLRNLSRGVPFLQAGSSSEDLAGAARIAPLVACYRENLEALVDAARTQTQMTHNHPTVIDCAEFFARVTWKVLKGKPPVKALEETADENFQDSPLSKWVGDGIASGDRDSVATIVRFGQSCHFQEALPGVVHLIARYQDDPEEALIQAVMAGGDSAGRGMIAGMVLGARSGLEGLPDPWISGLVRYKKIVNLLKAMP